MEVSFIGGGNKVPSTWMQSVTGFNLFLITPLTQQKGCYPNCFHGTKSRTRYYCNRFRHYIFPLKFTIIIIVWNWKCKGVVCCHFCFYTERIWVYLDKPLSEEMFYLIHWRCLLYKNLILKRHNTVKHVLRGHDLWDKEKVSL